MYRYLALYWAVIATELYCRYWLLYMFRTPYMCRPAVVGGGAEGGWCAVEGSAYRVSGGGVRDCVIYGTEMSRCRFTTQQNVNYD